MNVLKDYWNAASLTVPDDKDPSAYAIEKEKLFPRGAVVCDLAAGSGSDSLYFAGQGHRVKLVDISDVGLSRAARAAAERKLADSIATYVCDLGEGALPLPDASCDIVYSRLGLHYFEPDVLAKLLADIYRILKPGGKAYITLKSPEDAAEIEYLKKTATEKAPGVFEEGGHLKTRYSLAQLKDIAQAAGLSEQACSMAACTENLGGRKDRVNSGNKQLLLNEIQITK